MPVTIPAATRPRSTGDHSISWTGVDGHGPTGVAVAAYGRPVSPFSQLVDVRDPAVLRRVWGTGIGVVMLVAVAPYPVTAFFVDDEIPHRIHNITGALQYLPLWAVPVLMLTWGRDAVATIAPAWRIALVSSCVMFAVGVASGDLIPSLSWMPLLTLVPLWRVGAWRSPRLPSIAAAVAVALAAYVTVRHAPHQMDLQRLDMGDSHSARFHFSGMAAAYAAVTGALAVVGVYATGRTLRLVVAGSAVVAGMTSLVWTNYESALPATDAWLMVAAGLLSASTSGRPRRDVAHAIRWTLRPRAGRPAAPDLGGVRRGR